MMNKDSRKEKRAIKVTTMEKLSPRLENFPCHFVKYLPNNNNESRVELS
jgi:hypothetical protein